MDPARRYTPQLGPALLPLAYVSGGSPQPKGGRVINRAFMALSLAAEQLLHHRTYDDRDVHARSLLGNLP